MKRLMLLAVLMMALGLNAGGRVASSNEATAGAAGERPGYKYGADHQITKLKKNYSKKKLSPAGPTNEAEIKRLR